MELIMMCKLDENERRVIRERVLPNFGIGYPGYADQDMSAMDRADRPIELRVLRMIAEGNAFTKEQAELAVAVCDTIIQACQVQAEPDWWLENVIRIAEGTVRNVAVQSGEGSPLVLDPQRFAREMAQNRIAQCHAVAEGGGILLEAVASMSYHPPMGA